MEHGDAIRAVYDLRAQLERKDRQLSRRDAANKNLLQELSKAKDNIGELNSTIVRLERTLEDVRRANKNQALTIAGQAQELTSLNRKLKVLDESLVQRTRERDVLLDRLEELEAIENQWPDDDAPNLALAACKKKMEQLEGMLEGQRRSTRELGVNLQRVRDERAALRNDANYLQEQLKDHQETLRLRETALGIAQRGRLAAEKERDQWRKRAQVAEEKIAETRAQTMAPVSRLLFQALRERDDYMKQLQDLQRRANRAKSILDPVKVTETWDGDTRIEWTEGSMGGGVTMTPQAKKAEPRKCEASFPGVHGGHRCERTGDEHGRTQHLTQHRCHCGWVWD